MCNLYSITTNQAAIAALFRVVNRYVGNLAPMPGVFPDYRPRWCATPTLAARQCGDDASVAAGRTCRKTIDLSTRVVSAPSTGLF
jgi:hypothetical protein